MPLSANRRFLKDGDFDEMDSNQPAANVGIHVGGFPHAAGSRSPGRLQL